MASDALSDALGSLQLSAGMFPRTELAVPWGVDVDPLPCVVFHLMARGHGRLEISDEAAIELGPGDLVVIPHGDAHRLVDADGSSSIKLVRMLQERDPFDEGPVHVGGPGAPSASLVCGFFELDPTGADLVLSCLPRVMRVAAQDVAHRVGWLSTTLEIVRDEVGEARPGAAALLDQLAGVLFIQVLRAHLDAMPEQGTGWLAGLGDPRIAAAMTRIHRSPQTAWSVDELAAAAGMSRSAFHARFRELVGLPPAQYLARWRMHRAAVLLRREQLGVGEAAQRVGYESEATFAKAFKRYVGVPPATYRETAVKASFGAQLGRRSA